MINFNWGIDTLITNVGVRFEWIVLIILLVGSLIFFALDFRTGALMLFLMSGATSLWFYAWGLDFTRPLIICFMGLIIMCFSLFAVGKTQTAGGVA